MKNLSVTRNFVKKSSATLAATAFALTLAACGDSGDSSNNVEREEDSSSSVEESSSSAEEESSSSEEDVSSSSNGTRAATLDDLTEKNYTLGSMFGTEVFLAVGNKQGVFSLWIPDLAWVGFHSDFAKGVLEVSEKAKNGGFLGADTSFADSLEALYTQGIELKVIVDENDSLQYSLNGGDYKKLEVYTKVKTLSSTLYDGSKLAYKTLECKTDSDTTLYTFYEGRYLAENEGDGTWEAGYYDIQRSHLLMLPTYLNKKAYAPMTTMTVSDDYNMTDVSGNSISCESSDFKYTSIDAESLAAEWVSDEGGYDWTLKLGENGDYSIDAKEGSVSIKTNSGTWAVYGDLLLLTNTSCTYPNKCVTGVKGNISGFDAKKGFTLTNSDTEDPTMPEGWSVPQYE